MADCIPYGVQTGVQTLVGNALGAQQPQSARLTARVGLLMAIVVMAAQAALLIVFRRAWTHLFTAEPAVGLRVASLLPWVVLFNMGDGIQIVVSGVITGAGKQAVTTPILGLAYWVIGLPLGAVAAFYVPGNGLLGLWMGMTLAVWVHVSAYLFICFAGHGSARARCWGIVIDWPAAAKMAAARLVEPAEVSSAMPSATLASSSGGEAPTLANAHAASINYA